MRSDTDLITAMRDGDEKAFAEVRVAAIAHVTGDRVVPARLKTPDPPQ